ncbi:MAG: hypothetical protein ACKO34_00745 [Vampirovibrionales bacterium]
MMTSLYSTPNYGYATQPSYTQSPAYGSVATSTANAYADNSTNNWASSVATAYNDNSSYSLNQQTYAPTANLSQENYLAYTNLNYAPTDNSSVYNHYNPQQYVNTSYYNLQRPQVQYTQPTHKKEGGGNDWLTTLLPIVAMLFLIPGGLGGLFGGASRSSASASATAKATARSSSDDDDSSTTVRRRRTHTEDVVVPTEEHRTENNTITHNTTNNNTTNNNTTNYRTIHKTTVRNDDPKTPTTPSKESIQVSVQAGLYGDPVSIVKNKDGTVLSHGSLTKDSELFKDMTSRLYVDMNTIGKHTYAQEYTYNVNGNTIVAGKDGKVTVDGKVVPIGQTVQLKGGGSVKVTKATGVTNNDEQMPRAYNVEIKAPNEAGDGYENVTFYASKRKTDGNIAYNMDLSKTHKLDNKDERVTSGYYAKDFAKEYARLSK